MARRRPRPSVQLCLPPLAGLDSLAKMEASEKLLAGLIGTEIT